MEDMKKMMMKGKKGSDNERHAGVAMEVRGNGNGRLAVTVGGIARSGKG